MPNHTNRSRAKIPAANPDKDQVLGVRFNSKLTQKQAAAMIYCGENTWQKWEAGDRRMHPAMYELFLIKTGQKKI